MTFMLNFSVEGDPVAKGRPKFSSRGGFVKTYTPKKTVTYEHLVREEAVKAIGSSEPLETPVGVFIYIRLPIPKSYPKKRREACLNGFEKPCKKPDLDNLAKSVMDAMNGVVFKDDSQIVSLHCKKVYADFAGVDIAIKEELE